MQLLRMGRINAVVMPVLATLVCILLVAYHLKDPTEDGQVCPIFLSCFYIACAACERALTACAAAAAAANAVWYVRVIFCCSYSAAWRWLQRRWTTPRSSEC